MPTNCILTKGINFDVSFSLFDLIGKMPLVQSSTFIYHLLFTISKERHEYMNNRTIVIDGFPKEIHLVKMFQ